MYIGGMCIFVHENYELSLVLDDISFIRQVKQNNKLKASKDIIINVNPNSPPTAIEKNNILGNNYK